ncbi:MAG: V-type ATPase 116kDa subunit family protein [Bacteroidota bacterium]
MKAAFRKLDLLLHCDEREHVTALLQELGVIHLELNNNFRNEALEELELRKSRVLKAIECIESYTKNENFRQIKDDSAGAVTDQLINEILTLKLEKESLQQEIELLNKHHQKLIPWGDFDPEKLKKLEKAGLKIILYAADRKAFRDYHFKDILTEVIYEGSDRTYFAVLSASQAVSIPFERVELPALRISDIAHKKDKLQTVADEITTSISNHLPLIPALKKELLTIENEWKLLLAKGSYTRYASGKVLHISGWFPANVEDKLTHYLEQEKISYLVSDPTSTDKVPVLLKNHKYPKLFETITKVFQLPNYYEMDLTPFIAVFYPILFAYCLGDAGYGIILLFVAIIGWFTFLKSSRSMAVLGVILGLFTTILGVVKSGSLFGQPITTDESNPLFQFLAQYIFIPDDNDVVFNAFNVALMIGVVQILTGIIISIINKIKYHGFIQSLSQQGKLLMVISLIWLFLADMQGVEPLQPFEALRKVLLALGVILVLFFHDLKQPVLSRTASGILPLFFILTGILGDVLSYVRLFALGVASSVLGLVVNQIGANIMEGAWWGIVLGVVFMLIGHSLNFALATLGAFVHPLRLTFVEFYNNANFEGGGVAYSPLRKIESS